MKAKYLAGLLILSILLLSGCSNITTPITSSCEAEAKKLIPEEIRLHTSYAGDWFSERGHEFKVGSKKGQNINHYYGNYYYSKTEISDDGTILGTNSFSAHLETSPLPRTREGFNQYFEVINIEFITCKWEVYK